jgi:oligoribonuclease
VTTPEAADIGVKYLLWLDLETTGLEPQSDRILEVGCVFTDVELNELGTFHRVLSYGEEFMRAHCADVVLQMHEQSGLLAEVTGPFPGASGILRDVEEDLIWFLKKHMSVFDRYSVVMAGSSIHFDRGFTKYWMPHFDRHVHYRMLDVTAFRYALLPVVGADFKMQKTKAHRAMADIRESIAEYKMLVKQFLTWRERGGEPCIKLD